MACCRLLPVDLQSSRLCRGVRFKTLAVDRRGGGRAVLGSRPSLCPPLFWLIAYVCAERGCTKIQQNASKYTFSGLKILQPVGGCQTACGHLMPVGPSEFETLLRS